MIVTATGGGAKSKLWIQIKANILNKTFLIPQCSELACQGAAMLSAIGTSQFKDVNEITEKWVKYQAEIHPSAVNAEKYKNWYRIINKKN